MLFGSIMSQNTLHSEATDQIPSASGQGRQSIGQQSYLSPSFAGGQNSSMQLQRAESQQQMPTSIQGSGNINSSANVVRRQQHQGLGQSSGSTAMERKRMLTANTDGQHFTQKLGYLKNSLDTVKSTLNDIKARQSHSPLSNTQEYNIGTSNHGTGAVTNQTPISRQTEAEAQQSSLEQKYNVLQNQQMLFQENASYSNDDNNTSQVINFNGLMVPNVPKNGVNKSFEGYRSSNSTVIINSSSLDQSQILRPSSSSGGLHNYNQQQKAPLNSKRGHYQNQNLPPSGYEYQRPQSQPQARQVLQNVTNDALNQAQLRFSNEGSLQSHRKQQAKMLSETIIPMTKQSDQFEQTSQQPVTTFSPNNMTTNLTPALLFGSTMGGSGNIDLPLAHHPNYQQVSSNPYQDTISRAPIQPYHNQHINHNNTSDNNNFMHGSAHTTQDASFHRLRQLEEQLNLRDKEHYQLKDTLRHVEQLNTDEQERQIQMLKKRIDSMLLKETELQEELSDMQRAYSELDDALRQKDSKVIEALQEQRDKYQLELHEQQKKSDERELYIKGLEKSNRQLEMENKHQTQQDMETVNRIKALERDVNILSEQNGGMARNIKDKELTISHLEKSLIEVKRENQQILQDLTSRIGEVPESGHKKKIKFTQQSNDNINFYKHLNFLKNFHYMLKFLKNYIDPKQQQNFLTKPTISQSFAQILN